MRVHRATPWPTCCAECPATNIQKLPRIFRMPRPCTNLWRLWVHWKMRHGWPFSNFARTRIENGAPAKSCRLRPTLLLSDTTAKTGQRWSFSSTNSRFSWSGVRQTAYAIGQNLISSIRAMVATVAIVFTVNCQTPNEWTIVRFLARMYLCRHACFCATFTKQFFARVRFLLVFSKKYMEKFNILMRNAHAWCQLFRFSIKIWYASKASDLSPYIGRCVGSNRIPLLACSCGREAVVMG